MTDKENDDKSIKVDDRRTSAGGSGKGVEAADVDEKSVEEPAGDADSENTVGTPGGKEGSVPQVDFSTFVFSLFSSALIQLGDMADPTTGQIDKNLQAAHQTIDILDILIRKTEGNLSEEEERLLKNASAELKWKYLDAVKENR